jgi:hypothetical protein
METDEILKVDERKVIRKGDKILFTLYQEQEYSEETRKNIVKDLKEQLKRNEEWLRSFEKIKIENIERLTRMLEDNKKKLEKDSEMLKKTIDLWENPVSE